MRISKDALKEMIDDSVQLRMANQMLSPLVKIQNCEEEIKEIKSMLKIDNKSCNRHKKELKLEVGKFYRLRNGKKGWCYYDDGRCKHSMRVAALDEDEGASLWYSRDGKLLLDVASEYDIVAEWED